MTHHLAVAACGMPIPMCVACLLDGTDTPAPYVYHGMSMCLPHVRLWADPATFTSLANRPGETHV